MGNGRQIKLWDDMCGMESLATKFLDIYSITVKKEASMADFWVCDQQAVRPR